MEWTSKHQNFKSANDKAVFRSSVNKEQRLACEKKEQRQRRLQERRLQLRREARKRREQSRRRLKKKNRNRRSDSKLNGSEGQHMSVSNNRTKVAGYWIKATVMLAAMKMKPEQQRNQRQKYMHNQQFRIQRRCE